MGGRSAHYPVQSVVVCLRGEGWRATSVVRVCVVASPVALCASHRGHLATASVSGDVGPPIGGVCVVSPLATGKGGGGPLGLCLPP